MRITKKEFNQIEKKLEKNRVCRPRQTSPIHQDNLQNDKRNEELRLLYETWQCAKRALHYLQSTRGDLFLGRSRFELWTQIFGKSRAADESNVYKGCEDALNRIAFYDDKQNEMFRKPFCEDNH
jgi:hypothetical protein